MKPPAFVYAGQKRTWTDLGQGAYATSFTVAGRPGLRSVRMIVEPTGTTTARSVGTGFAYAATTAEACLDALRAAWPEGAATRPDWTCAEIDAAETPRLRDVLRRIMRAAPKAAPRFGATFEPTAPDRVMLRATCGTVYAETSCRASYVGQSAQRCTVSMRDVAAWLKSKSATATPVGVGRIGAYGDGKDETPAVENISNGPKAFAPCAEWSFDPSDATALLRGIDATSAPSVRFDVAAGMIRATDADGGDAALAMRGILRPIGPDLAGPYLFDADLFRAALQGTNGDAARVVTFYRAPDRDFGVLRVVGGDATYVVAGQGEKRA